SRIPRREELVPGDREALPTVRRHLAFDAGVAFDNDRHAPQGAVRWPRIGVLARRGRASLLGEYLLDGAIDAVVAMNAVEVPIDDLRDRVAVLRVVTMQLGNRDFQQVPVHHGRAR